MNLPSSIQPEALALAHRRSLREDSLLGVPVPLNDRQGLFGPAILPLNFWHVLLLSGYLNPFATKNGLITLEAAFQYLWFCSPECARLHADPLQPVRSGGWRFLLFCRRWRGSITELRRDGRGRLVRGISQRTIDAIRAHFSVMTLDRPPFPKEKQSKTARATPSADGPHELVTWELLCRRLLDYTRREFWFTPVAYTNQLLTVALRAQYGDEMPTFTGDEKRIGEYLRKKKAARAADQSN